jgi:hypothetical protein
VNPADTLEGEDRYHKMTGARRELPDNRVYGLFFAMEPAIVSTLYMGKASGAGVLATLLQTSQRRGKRNLTITLGRGTQTAEPKSVWVLYEVHGPAAAKALSPRTFEPPPNIKKMITTMQPAMYDEKSAEGMCDKKSAEGMHNEKSAEGLYDMKAAMVDKLATHKTDAVKGDQCQHRFVAMIEGLARDVLAREENKTDRKKKLPRQEALSPSECREDCRGWT